jgi:hypothetical protein
MSFPGSMSEFPEEWQEQLRQERQRAEEAATAFAELCENDRKNDPSAFMSWNPKSERATIDGRFDLAAVFCELAASLSRDRSP